MGSRETLLQTIVENACDLCCAGSAGISLLEEHDGQRYFRWLSVAGEVFASHTNVETRGCNEASSPGSRQALHRETNIGRNANEVVLYGVSGCVVKPRGVAAMRDPVAQLATSAKPG
jgi:hypothetical protein